MTVRPHAAVILAAGEGRRMGGPKALLELAGEPLLRLHARALGALCPVLVVVRPAIAAEVRQLLDSRVRVHEGEAATQAASLGLVVRELSTCAQPGSAILITPVDVMPASEATLKALCSALEPGRLAATPAYRGRGGHPVLVRMELLGALLDPSSEPASLRTLLASAGRKRVRVEVSDAHIVRDFDTPEQARRARLALAAVRFGSD
jgi:molybdenum cofactor cytidylyltransferase